MSSLKSYHVSFLDWTVYSARIAAPSARKAIAVARALYEAKGSEAFDAVEGTQDKFEAEEVES